VSSLLLNRSEQPSAVLDGDGTVRAHNLALERLLESPPDELVGRLWSEVTRAPARSGAWLRNALAGTLRRHDCTARTRAGRALSLRLDLVAVQRSGGPALCISVVSSQLLEPSSRDPVRSVEFEISSSEPSFGKVGAVFRDDYGMLARDGVARSCYRALHGRESPCDGCPVRSASSGDGPMALRPDGFAVVATFEVERSVHRVREWIMSDGVVGALIRAKVASAAERAGLSHRQREVLGYLLLGRTAEQIGRLLQITPRTAKFHQARILERLGAESRVDLVRLIM